MNPGIPNFDVGQLKSGINNKITDKTEKFSGQKFSPVHVDLENFELSQKIKKMIYEGKEVTDRSSAMLSASMAFLRANMNDDQILSILTDSSNVLGEAAMERGSQNRSKAAAWVRKYTLEKAKHLLSAEGQFRNFKSSSEEKNGSESSTNLTKGLRLEFEDFKDITFVANSNSLIENYIDKQSLILVYGPSNSGKSFFVLDLALHVALGKIWNGLKVSQGPVIYIAAEGGRRFSQRILAYKKFLKLEDADIPFVLARGTIDLLATAPERDLLIKKIEETSESFYQPTSLVVIDTFSRVLAGGDENGSTDMGQFIQNVDIIRQRTGVAILIVHHSGKDLGKGARGHSTLKAAVDTEIEISEIGKRKKGINPTKRAKTTKQRDNEFGEDILFELKTIRLAVDGSNFSVNSCVVSKSEKQVSDFDDTDSDLKVGTHAAIAFEVFNQLYKDNSVCAPSKMKLRPQSKVIEISQWRHHFFQKLNQDLKKSSKYEAFNNAKKKLILLRRITSDSVFVWPNNEHQNSGISAPDSDA